MKTYEVVGPRKVRGHSKGEKFKAEMSEQQEARLVKAGHIAVVPPKATPPKNTEEN
jgi:hypothetical protein